LSEELAGDCFEGVWECEPFGLSLRSRIDVCCEQSSCLIAPVAGRLERYLWIAPQPKPDVGGLNISLEQGFEIGAGRLWTSVNV